MIVMVTILLWDGQECTIMLLVYTLTNNVMCECHQLPNYSCVMIALPAQLQILSFQQCYPGNFLLIVVQGSNN